MRCQLGVQSIQLISNNLCYGPALDMDKEVECLRSMYGTLTASDSAMGDYKKG